MCPRVMQESTCTHPTGNAVPAVVSRTMISSFSNQKTTFAATSTTTLTMAGCCKKRPALPTHRLPKAFIRRSILTPLSYDRPVGRPHRITKLRQQGVFGSLYPRTNLLVSQTSDPGDPSRLVARARSPDLVESFDSAKCFHFYFKLVLFCDTSLTEGTRKIAD